MYLDLFFFQWINLVGFSSILVLSYLLYGSVLLRRDRRYCRRSSSLTFCTGLCCWAGISGTVGVARLLPLVRVCAVANESAVLWA